MSKLTNIAAGLLTPQIDADTTAWLVLDGKEYELTEFNIGFSQSTDHNGQPQSEVRGGRMLITLNELVPESVYKWAMTSTTRSGEVIFRARTTNAPLRIEFMNAYCTNFERTISQSEGLGTTLMISPEEILMNGINFDNRWAK